MYFYLGVTDDPKASVQPGNGGHFFGGFRNMGANQDVAKISWRNTPPEV